MQLLLAFLQAASARHLISNILFCIHLVHNSEKKEWHRCLASRESSCILLTSAPRKSHLCFAAKWKRIMEGSCIGVISPTKLTSVVRNFSSHCYCWHPPKTGLPYVFDVLNRHVPFASMGIGILGASNELTVVSSARQNLKKVSLSAYMLERQSHVFLPVWRNMFDWRPNEDAIPNAMHHSHNVDIAVLQETRLADNGTHREVVDTFFMA